MRRHTNGSPPARPDAGLAPRPIPFAGTGGVRGAGPRGLPGSSAEGGADTGVRVGERWRAGMRPAATPGEEPRFTSGGGTKLRGSVRRCGCALARAAEPTRVSRDRLTEEAQWLPLDAVAAHSLFSTTATGIGTVSYTHLRAHETVLDLVCRLLLEKKKKKI